MQQYKISDSTSERSRGREVNAQRHVDRNNRHLSSNVDEIQDISPRKCSHDDSTME